MVLLREWICCDGETELEVEISFVRLPALSDSDGESIVCVTSFVKDMPDRLSEDVSEVDHEML